MAAWDGDAAGRDSAGAAARAAVRMAEQTVGDAWIGRLLLTEDEAETALDTRARLREQAAERVRGAQRAGDPAALARAQLELEHADRAWGQAVDGYERAHGVLTEEVALWTRATASRVRQAWADRSAAGRR
jgi:hypothetical protein